MHPVPFSLRITTLVLVICRVLTLVIGVLFIAFIWWLPLSHPTAKIDLPVALQAEDYSLAAPATPSPLAPESSLKDATAKIIIPARAFEPVRSAYRWGAVPVAVWITAAYVWFLSLGIRVCRNVAAGRAFTEENILILHKLGIGMMVYVFLWSLSETWFFHQAWGVTNDVIRAHFANVSFIQPTSHGEGGIFYSESAPGHLTYYRFRPLDYLWGVAVLALGEVFRQGVKLQREAELTV